MKHPYLSIIFGLITCLSITAALSKTPNMAEQMALTNICETAMLTKDTMTAQHVAQRIMDWSGLEDTQIIESAIECLSNQHGKKVSYSIEEGFQFSKILENNITDPYSYTKNRWEKFIFENRIGNAEDYFLQKKLTTGWENVIVIMGFQNDWEACENVRTLFMSKNSLSNYRCIPANKPPS